MPKDDQTTKLPPTKRRMDELAWVLENTSMCAAVSVINSRFYIATNEFFSHTEKRKDNQQLNIVCEIMEYFKNVAINANFNSTLRQQKRDELMRTIIQNQLRVASFGRITIPDNMVNAIVCSDVLAGEKLPDISYDRGLREYIEKRKGQAHQALGYGIEIYKRFKKIEKAIEKANNKDFSKISESQLNAFKTFAHNDLDRQYSNILFLEKDEDKSVHAEAQILDQIVDFIDQKIALPKEIYIGISKRCCKNCHCLLEAANEVLEQEGGYVITFEGAHDAEFTAKWGRPPMLQHADLASRSKTRQQTKDRAATKALSLKEKINKRYFEKLSETEQLSQGSYDQRHTPSSSEATSEIKDRYRENLEEDLKVLLRRGLGSSPQADLLKLGIRLCSLNEFTDFFDETLMSTQHLDKEVIINNILIAYNQKNTDKVISKETLLQFLNNPDFCPETICNYFLDKKEGSTFSCGSGILADMDQLPVAVFGGTCSSSLSSIPIKDEQESNLHATEDHDDAPEKKRARTNSPNPIRGQR